MGGPKPAGTKSQTARLTFGLLAQLGGAAKKRKVSLTQEIENRLSRSFLADTVVANEFGDQQLYAVARIVFAAARSTVNRRIEPPKDGHAPDGPPAKSWLHDARAFDAAVAAINKLFELIRPVGGPSNTDATYQPEFNALETVLEIQKAPAAQPVKASRHTRAMVSLRKDLGDVVDRAVIRGDSAEQIRKRSGFVKEFAALRRKQARTPATMTYEEVNRMKSLAGQIAGLVDS